VWDSIAEYAMKNQVGIWAVLFIALMATTVTLIRWVLKSNDSREARYIGVIDTQAKALGNFKGMADDVADIKRWLEPGGATRRGGG
jgi:hypothetical protein